MKSDQELSLDEKITKLNELVAWFESDEFALDSATDKYQQAKDLLVDIEKDINSLEQVFQVVGEK